ncbi:alpha/beta hydrolase [Idiomarina tyrosinivorans]|uniref:Alpha/beta hydrolase n=1 Tax=Idiomarina tyrosinivorans TaxID=1445662 RepID=A0A432ZRS7_9GAMM|nr:alpha/beta hydrolase [Idiomarina tyrosinivorans]
MLFFHGAGAGCDSAFMQTVAMHWAQLGAFVVRPDFPYWERIRETGKRCPPNSQAQLQQFTREVIQQYPCDNLILAGKSMGSRVATAMADELRAKAVVAMGFPFQPPGKAGKDRSAELQLSHCPGWIAQGRRDPFARNVNTEKLPANWQLQWYEAGDHSLQPSKRSGISDDQYWRRVAEHSYQFMREQC